MTQASALGTVISAAASGQQVTDDFNLSDQALATYSEGSSAPITTYPFMLWRNDTGKLVNRRNAANSGWDIIENYGATADPTVGDDSADGYVRGSSWINTTGNRVFWCVNPAAGAAVWVQAGSGAGGASSVFGRTGAVVATSGDYTADKITDGGGKVIMTTAERTAVANITFSPKVIVITGTDSNADNANIRTAIAAIKASGQPGEIQMSGDFKIGYTADKTGIDPDTCAFLKLTGRGYCRWYKGLAATTTGLTGGVDPGDGTAYRLLTRSTNDGPGKTLIISNIIFEGDLATTMKQLGAGSQLISLGYYDRIEIHDVEGRWGSQMGFAFGYCNQVRASRAYINRIAADGLNASNCSDFSVTDSDFEWIIGDCCAASLSPGDSGDLGQQRAFRFLNNRVYNCQGAKILGGKHVMVSGNSFRAPLNYAVNLGSDPSYGTGIRPIDDVLVLGNNISDLVTASQYGNSTVVDTGIIISQSTASPRNIVIRGNNLAQRTMTNGHNWSVLKLRGIAGENRQWRRDNTTGNMLWYDPALSGEIFVGQGKAIRIDATNGIDRLTYDVDDNHFEGFSDDAFMRSQPAWSDTVSWAVPASAGEFPIGAGARITGVDLRGYQQMRLSIKVGSAGGMVGSLLSWRFSLDGITNWTDTSASITITGIANQIVLGSWVDIPAALGQSVGVLALFGSAGDGTTQIELMALGVDVRGIDQTSASMLIPMQVLPSEKQSGNSVELRSFAPKDIADMITLLAGTGGGTGGNIDGGDSTSSAAADIDGGLA